jgi:uncharacterized protein
LPKEIEITDTDLKIQGLIHIVGSISIAGDVLLVEGKLKTKVGRTCSRCLKEFVSDVEVDISERFFPANAEYIEKDAFSYDSDIVDITEALRESLIIAEPLQALCKKDCKGLCPVCGADKNVELCNCDTFTIDPRLVALKQFLKN